MTPQGRKIWGSKEGQSKPTQKPTLQSAKPETLTPRPRQKLAELANGLWRRKAILAASPEAGQYFN